MVLNNKDKFHIDRQEGIVYYKNKTDCSKNMRSFDAETGPYFIVSYNEIACWEGGDSVGEKIC